MTLNCYATKVIVFEILHEHIWTILVKSDEMFATICGLASISAAKIRGLIIMHVSAAYLSFDF